MASMSREELEKAVEKALGSDFEVLATDVGDDIDTDAADEEVLADVSSATLDAVRRKYESLLGGVAPDMRKLEDGMTVAVVRPVGDALGDDATGGARVRVFSDDGEVVAEQG